MGQLTQSFVDLALAACSEGRHPPLTIWETRQLLLAWSERERSREAARIHGYVCPACGRGYTTPSGGTSHG